MNSCKFHGGLARNHVAAEQASGRTVAFGQYKPEGISNESKDKEHQADRGGQREENRRDNPRRLDHGEEGQKSPKHLDTRELPEPQKEDARRRQESGGRKG